MKTIKFCGARQTMSRTLIGRGMRPSLAKPSATCCWVSITSSVTGPMAKLARFAATVWISSGTPVIVVQRLCDLVTMALGPLGRRRKPGDDVAHLPRPLVGEIPIGDEERVGLARLHTH